jgi:hypothetical protein
MWSWHKLVEECDGDEEVALTLLPLMKGYGEYDANMAHYNEGHIDEVRFTPFMEIFDVVKLPATPISQLHTNDTYSVGLNQWKKNDTNT